MSIATVVVSIATKLIFDVFKEFDHFGWSPKVFNKN